MIDKETKINTKTFLKDVLICSLGAYGGPEAHYGVFTDQMVVKKNYLTEDELVEMIALTGVLPGPSSTQTITSIGYKVGGPKLAFLTLLVWALPAIIIMTVLSFLYFFMREANLDTDALRLIGPMAVGFIVVAAYRIGRKVIKSSLTLGLFIFGGIATYFFRAPWVFPLVLILGGVTVVLASKEKELWNHVKLNPPWKYLMTFIGIAGVSMILVFVFSSPIIFLFESFYRYGYLVIGGGQVVIPYMYTDLVEIHGLMTSEQFLTGFGLVQGIPGPMFSFSAYAGGLASSDQSGFIQVISAIVSGVAIFLPGTLLIFFVYPIWENLKKIKGIKISLAGITAVAGGLIATAAIVLMDRTGFSLENMLVMLITVGLLLTKKIPAPIIVGLVIAIGFLL
ncbi:MAG: chromate efflux transporter [Acholeplasmataceae bacterium]|jgi:chromate transporter|nr:chromate efflux transporter [Acholeplasmataceae bacterium]